MPRVAEEVFQRIKTLDATHECSVYASYVEIYMEALTDLLAGEDVTLTGATDHCTQGLAHSLVHFVSERRMERPCYRV